MSEKNNTEQMLSSILEGILKVKGQDITILDLRSIENAVCSYFVICTGGSNTQVSPSLEQYRDKLLRNHGM